MTVPYTFANQTGSIPLSELDANFSNVSNYSSSAGTVVSNAQPNITSVGTLVSLSVTGNITGSYFLGNGSQLTGLSATYGNANVVANLAALGSNPVSTTGNITGGNIRTVGLITATGNVTGNYFIGNGSQLTGINIGVQSSLANGTSNVSIPAVNGNVSINTSNSYSLDDVVVNDVGLLSPTLIQFEILKSSAPTLGSLVKVGATVADTTDPVHTTTVQSAVTEDSTTWFFSLLKTWVDAYYVSNQINISGSDSYQWIFDTDGNLTSPGQITATGNVTGNYFIGNGSQLTGLSSSYGNANVVANLAALGTNPISTTGNISANYYVGNGSLLTGIGVSSYGNANVVANLAALGSNPISTTGNITGGNVLFGSGVVSGTGNVSGNVGTFTTHNGTTFSASGNITAGNANISGTTASTSKTTGALKVAGGVGVAGDIYAGNSVVVDGGAYGNVTTTQFASVFGAGSGPNPYSVMQVRSSDGVSGLGMQAFTGSGILYGNTAITFVTGATIRDRDVYSGGTTRAYLDSTGLTVTGIANISGNITGSNLSVGTGIVSIGSLVNNNSNGVGNIGSATTYFNTVFAQATSAQYADLAENYLADAPYVSGTVVSIGGDAEVTQSSVDADGTVIGVVSTNPAYHMNAGLAGGYVVAVALTGRVPCRVTGSVKRGSAMVSNGDGTARAEESPKPGTIIGKALTSFNGNTGVIEVVVGRF